MPGPLLVVTIDRLPAWILPAYGATWVATPAIDRLAARGVVFDGLVATADDPRAAVRDLLGWLEAGPTSLAVVSDDPDVARVIGPAESTVVPVTMPPVQAADEAATHLARLFTAAAEVVANRRHEVVWCHAGSLGMTWDADADLRLAYVDPDDPPPPPGAEVPDLAVTAETDPDLVVGLRHLYAAQVTLLDRCLAPLLAAAAADATILLAGVRGMPLGLHGRVGPGPLPPYAELVRLPAILVDHAGRMAAQRHGGLIVPADLGATIAELTGGHTGASNDPWAGRSLAAVLDRWSDEGRDRVIVEGSAGIAVVTRAWHLLCVARPDGPAVRLFAKPDDCFDLCDVADRCPAVVDDLRPLAEAAAGGGRMLAWTASLGAGGSPAE